MSVEQVRDWIIGLLLTCALIISIIEWQRPSRDYVWRAWAETALRTASHADDGPYSLQLADWAFRMRGDDADPRTVRRLSALLLANGHERERSALLAFEALRRSSSSLGMTAYEADANVLTAWLAATALIADGKPVPLGIEAQLLSADWRYANHYSCRKELGVPAGSPVSRLPTTPAAHKWGLTSTAFGGEGLFRGILPKSTNPDHAASAKCVVERQTALRDPQLVASAQSFLEADKQVSYWANAANSRAEISRRAADRDSWASLANRNKFGACVAGAILPDERDVAMLGAGAISKTFRNRVTPVLGPLMAAADCGEAMNKIDNARKQVGALNAAIQEIASGETLRAHRSSRSNAAKSLSATLENRVSQRQYAFRADQVLEVLDGGSVVGAFLQ